jgi:hypothetical protein
LSPVSCGHIVVTSPGATTGERRAVHAQNLAGDELRLFQIKDSIDDVVGLSHSTRWLHRS